MAAFFRPVPFSDQGRVTGLRLAVTATLNGGLLDRFLLQSQAIQPVDFAQ